MSHDAVDRAQDRVVSLMKIRTKREIGRTLGANALRPLFVRKDRWMSADPNFDDFLLDIATSLELSDHDRNLVEGRYRRLKEHLERPASPLKDHLVGGESRIYAQGSIAIGATIVSGEKDDRFDLDAMVEINVPSGWDENKALDELYKTLLGFPDVKSIERCTRCVQMQFATMHIDVTIMDPYAEPRSEREGEIFHSPDSREGYRVAANPFGFSDWFRQTVGARGIIAGFSDTLTERRVQNALNRIEIRAAEQDDLPPILPARFDAQEVIALKLLKRFLNVKYANRDLKKPPSVYVSKLAAICGRAPHGLAAQLDLLAKYISGQMNTAIAAAAGPDERNPVFDPDRLNDRWPTSQTDRITLRNDMNELVEQLETARRGTINEIFSTFGKLFGETIGRKAATRLAEREDNRDGSTTSRFIKETGTILASTAIASPAVAQKFATVPKHNFHFEILKNAKKKDH